MPLRYSDRPVLSYGGQQSPDNNWRSRFPAHARPIATAPSNTSRPVWVYEPDGHGWLSIFHNGQWQKMRRDHDNRSGTSQLRMTGEPVSNPVMWASS